MKSVSSPDEAPRSSSKKPAARRIFNSPLSVSSGHKTQRLMIYILLIKQRESSPIIYVKRAEKFIAWVALNNTRFVIFGR